MRKRWLLVASAPQVWRESKQRYKLIGFECENCKRPFFVERVICPNCKSRKIREIRLGAEGTVESFTVIFNPPKKFEYHSPYIIGLIKLKKGVKVIGQIVDCLPQEVKVGLEVEVSFRIVSKDEDTGLIMYGYKFRPKIY